MIESRELTSSGDYNKTSNVGCDALAHIGWQMMVVDGLGE